MQGFSYSSYNEFQRDAKQYGMTTSKETPTSNKTRILGICLGASTVSVVQLESNSSSTGITKPVITDSTVYPHEGNPRKALIKALRAVNPESFDRIAVTGRQFRRLVNLTSIPEPEAVEYAYSYVKPEGIDCPAVVSAGGETFMVYILDRNGRIANVVSGNKCASGTGEFFLQQLRRMDISLDQVADWSATKTPYHVSGRCSVFCKSDCTHATNKGTPKSKVTAGLCQMMADKILELLNKVEKQNIMISGGVAQNQIMIEYLKNKISSLIIPEHAPCFEALGAALWATQHETRAFPGIADLFSTTDGAFERLEALSEFQSLVIFKTMERGNIKKGDVCIIGLDVGSTTTKAVLMRQSDNAILSSVYLRTNGDPVGASRQCYAAILEHIRNFVDPCDISITGLGVCGSGRQIAGLHSLTDCVVNEIVAHCSAAVYFDPDVDTLFEIGGQDAKYTYITAGVPSDYAMNEACSAGTGSFLEESALETLGIPMDKIAEIAIQSKQPPNFNDQCAAFISSDIKNAVHEGIDQSDIVAGLVYSICMNYTNRVKGNRPVGEKVFMQGGVCYNKAVPLAMASLLGKPIIVPPEPGLMGAFGVALEAKKRMAAGLIKEKRFDLEVLQNREVIYDKTFVCKVDKEKCDRRCEISVIEVEGKKYPFGGACNRYYNLRRKIVYDADRLDIVQQRQEMVLKNHFPLQSSIRNSGAKTIGINRSFLLNTYFPLYSTFFTELGLEVVLPDAPSKKGIEQKGAAFCYPAELAHGFFDSLIKQKTHLDYVFLPHFKAVPSSDGSAYSETCPFVQTESFYLSTAFGKELKQLELSGTKMLTPLIDLTKGLTNARIPLLKTAEAMCFKSSVSSLAFEKALACQNDFKEKMEELLLSSISELEANPHQIAVVIFGRPYNAFASEAHMGIPRKFASRGIKVLPLDFLPMEDEPSKRHMYWGTGKLIIKAAHFVARHPQLFGTYITNFSCGPDSFLIGYFRDIMGQKPSLTLELDSHTADAGLETRIEAFLDVISAYRNLSGRIKKNSPLLPFVPAHVYMENRQPFVVTSSGKTLSMKDPNVTVLFPSMGKIATEALASVFRGYGFNAVAHRPADEAVLKLGRSHTSCKECLPLILTTGTLINYIKNIKRKDEVLVYFMVTGSGPCRFGQYYIFMEDLVKKLGIPDVAMFSLTSDDGYAGMDQSIHQKALWAVIVSDVMEDIRSVLLTNASDSKVAIDVFTDETLHIYKALEAGSFKVLEKQLSGTASVLSKIKLKRSLSQTPTIALVGEIFVRRDDLSRQFLIERLASQGFATACAPVAEWLYYSDYLIEKGKVNEKPGLKQRLALKLKLRYMRSSESRIKEILSKSGLVLPHHVDIDNIIAHALPFMSVDFAGEAILTIGSAISEAVTNVCGVIAIGPFGCMPNRISEAILSEVMTSKTKMSSDSGSKKLKAVLEDIDKLPFLAIESDGSAFPQIINANIETFCLRAKRLHEKILANQ